jgi:hypothetical protein
MDHLQRRTGIDECPEEHVAGDPGRGVDPGKDRAVVRSGCLHEAQASAVGQGVSLIAASVLSISVSVLSTAGIVHSTAGIVHSIAGIVLSIRRGSGRGGEAAG